MKLELTPNIIVPKKGSHREEVEGPVLGNYKVRGWRESLFFKVLQTTHPPAQLHCSLGLTSQGFPFPRLPDIRGELLVESKEMFHSLPIGCKKDPSMDEK